MVKRLKAFPVRPGTIEQSPRSLIQWWKQERKTKGKQIGKEEIKPKTPILYKNQLKMDHPLFV